jgi:hypothetical protein
VSEQALVDDLLTYIRNHFLRGDPDQELTDTTPLLRYGVLNSIRTAALLTYVRDELGIDTSRLEVTADTLATVRSLGRALSVNGDTP